MDEICEWCKHPMSEHALRIKIPGKYGRTCYLKITRYQGERSA